MFYRSSEQYCGVFHPHLIIISALACCSVEGPSPIIITRSAWHRHHTDLTQIHRLAVTFQKKRENNKETLMSGVKHVIESSLAYISKPLHHMMMAEPKIAKEKIQEMMEEKDQEETENENQKKMKQGEMKLSKFGFGFELTGFVAFLSWTGMCLYSLLGVLGVLLISLPMEPYFRKAWNDDIFVTVLMQGFGSAFLVISVGYFVMNYLLRKRNRDGNFKGVKKMLTVLCTISAVITILVYSALSVGLLVVIAMMGGIFLPYHFYLIFLIPALVFWCLLLHGIRKGKSGFVKAFLVFHYTIFGLHFACLALSSVGSAIGYGMFIIFPCGLLFIMVATFFFVFNIGFYIALHSIFLEEERTKKQKKKNIEFINPSF